MAAEDDALTGFPSPSLRWRMIGRLLTSRLGRLGLRFTHEATSIEAALGSRRMGCLPLSSMGHGTKVRDALGAPPSPLAWIGSHWMISLPTSLPRY